MKIKSRTCWVRPPLTWGTPGPCSVGYRPQQLRGVGAVAPGTNPRHGTRSNLPFRVKPGGFVSRPSETETAWYPENTAWYPKNIAVPAPGLAFGRLGRTRKAVKELGPGCPSDGRSSRGESRGMLPKDLPAVAKGPPVPTWAAGVGAHLGGCHQVYFALRGLSRRARWQVESCSACCLRGVAVFAGWAYCTR